MTSGDDVFWSQPRACFPLGLADGPDPARAILMVRLDPPAVGQRFGRVSDIDTVGLTPRHAGDNVPPAAFPMEVHILLLERPWGDGAAIGPDDARVIGWGTLVATYGDARATDVSMQDANGPRR